VIDAGEARRRLVARRLSPELEAHCRGVADTARDLAARWGADPEQAEVAGLLHDYCRELPRQEVLDLARKHGLEVGPLEADYPVQLLHGPLAARVLSRSSPAPTTEALDAIERHTVGGAAMSILARCLFVADAVAPGRTYAGVEELRRQAGLSLDDALRRIVRRDIERLERRGRAVHPAMRALDEELNG
jgi:predicted HD superfamily hydrolase involved in NAD metabolism